ncbi:spore germination protein [Gorillibacterium sp. sgz5001074]|uniref:spore germination protein n=1 Tax=Gorillibacterium sp. sgz5001074 TaxID=3446695 RepID=UPI003F6778C4
MHGISLYLKQNKDMLTSLFSECDDFVAHDFTIGGDKGIPACLFYISGMSDEPSIRQLLSYMSRLETFHREWEQDVADLCKKTITAGKTESPEQALSGLTDALLSGDSVLLREGSADAIIFDTSNLEHRPISEPVTEGVVKGPRDGFNESIQINLSLLRRRLRSTRLKSEHYLLGHVTKTEIRLAYLKDTVSETLLDEVKERLNRIDVDSILESQYIEEWIEDHTLSIFPQVESTERPDKVAAALLAGRVALFVDGTPFVMILPVTLPQLLISSEDYYQRYPFAWFIRFLRYIAAAFSMLLPSIYISVTTFHQEMVPTPLMISIVNSYEKVPFPVFVEALMMEFTFEILREAGIRLPRPIGQAVSIVGALVIGQAAVQAGLVSYAMVIVVSLTGIMSFVIPSYNLAISLRLLRFGFMFIGATLGLYGVLLGMLAVLIHIASLRSFGVPYLSPIAPVRLQAWEDTGARFPWNRLAKRSKMSVGHKKQ